MDKCACAQRPSEQWSASFSTAATCPKVSKSMQQPCGMMARLPPELLGRILLVRPLQCQSLWECWRLFHSLHLPVSDLRDHMWFIFYAALTERCLGCPQPGLLKEAAAFLRAVRQRATVPESVWKEVECGAIAPSLALQVKAVRVNEALLWSVLAELLYDEASCPTRQAVFGSVRLAFDSVHHDAGAPLRPQLPLSTEGEGMLQTCENLEALSDILQCS